MVLQAKKTGDTLKDREVKGGKSVRNAEIKSERKSRDTQTGNGPNDKVKQNNTDSRMNKRKKREDNNGQEKAEKRHCERKAKDVWHLAE